MLTDIKNAINSKYTVIAPETNISSSGWNGAGYIIIDPNTGSAGYMVSGGLGGAVCIVIGIGFLVAALAIMISTAGVGTPAAAAFLFLGLTYASLGLCLWTGNPNFLRAGLMVGPLAFNLIYFSMIVLAANVLSNTVLLRPKIAASFGTEIVCKGTGI